MVVQLFSSENNKSVHISQEHGFYFIAIFLFKALCGDPDPKKCPKLWGVFVFMPNWGSGECGVKEGQFCVTGKNTVSSPENTAYALCAHEVTGKVTGFGMPLCAKIDDFL